MSRNTVLLVSKNGGFLRRLLIVYFKGVELSASQGAGLLELWQGAGQVVWHHTRGYHLCAGSEEV